TDNGPRITSMLVNSALRIPHSALPSDRPTKVGLLAGWGRYPIVVAEALRAQGVETYCLGVKDHADPAIALLCADFDWIGVAKLGRAIRYFNSHGVSRVTMAGKIHKFRLFQPWAWIKHAPDVRTLWRYCQHFMFAT